MRLLIVHSDRSEQLELIRRVNDAHPHSDVDTAVTWASGFAKLKSTRYDMVLVSESLDGDKAGRQLLIQTDPPCPAYVISDHGLAGSITPDQLSDLLQPIAARNDALGGMLAANGELVIKQPKKWLSILIHITMAAVGAIVSAVTFVLNVSYEDAQLNRTVVSHNERLEKLEPAVAQFPIEIKSVRDEYGQLKTELLEIKRDQGKMVSDQSAILSSQQQLSKDYTALTSMLVEWKSSNEKRLDKLELKIDRKR